MDINFKYLVRQPVFFIDNGNVEKGYVAKQYFSNEIKDFSLDATGDNLQTDKFYMVKLHKRSYESRRFNEASLFASREDFMNRLNESWDSL